MNQEKKEKEKEKEKEISEAKRSDSDSRGDVMVKGLLGFPFAETTEKKRCVIRDSFRQYQLNTA